MATSSVTSTTAGGTAVTSIAATSAVADATMTSDRFLRLLVAQMQNQDPLDPMDNAQVTSQMAQINTVTGIDKLNTTVQGLSAQFVQLQAIQGASLVGHDVVVPGNRLDVDTVSGVGQGGFELPQPADAVKVEILSPSGGVLETINLGAEGAGMHSFDWPAGTSATTGGLTFRVTATSGGTSVAAVPLMRDRVDAVTANGTSFSLELQNSGSVPYSTVRAFN